MGLFDKLFGKAGKEPAAATGEAGVLRDSLKDEKYFDKEYQKREGIIKESEASLAEKEKTNTVQPFQYWSLAMDYFDKIRIMYSAGEAVAAMRPEYDKALMYYVKGWDENEATYADMINMTAMAVLLNIPASAFESLVAYVDKTEANASLPNWFPDALLGYLLRSRKPERPLPQNLLVPDIYKPLYQATEMPKEQAAAAVKDYLENWYHLNKEAPWYNTHTRNTGYKGYWAWEVAAIVKIMALSDDDFKNHPHYPYDMVHGEL
jgi:hypothetical protein